MVCWLHGSPIHTHRYSGGAPSLCTNRHLYGVILQYVCTCSKAPLSVSMYSVYYVRDHLLGCSVEYYRSMVNLLPTCSIIVFLSVIMFLIIDEAN